MFEEVDAFVTTTQSAKGTYLRAFQGLTDRQFEVIEHGLDIVRTPTQEYVPREGERIRIVVPGTITPYQKEGCGDRRRNCPVIGLFSIWADTTFTP
jgi:hypothetical protein